MLTIPRLMERVWFLKQENASRSNVNLTMMFSGKSSTSFSRTSIQSDYAANRATLAIRCADSCENTEYIVM